MSKKSLSPKELNRKNWQKYTPEQRQFLKPRRNMYRKQVEDNNCRFAHTKGQGADQLLLKDSDVDSVFYSKLGNAIDAVVSKHNLKLKGAYTNLSSVIRDTDGGFKYIDKESKISVAVNYSDASISKRNSETNSKNPFPTATIYDQSEQKSTAVSVYYDDFDAYYYSQYYVHGKGFSFEPTDEHFLSEMKDFQADPEYLKKQQEKAEERAAIAEQERAKREAEEKELALYRESFDNAEELRKNMAKEVAKFEFSIALHNTNLRRDEWNPAYLNKKHPDQTDYYKQYAKGVVAVNEGYKKPYWHKYSDIVAGQKNIKAYEDMTMLEMTQADTMVELYNADQLARRVDFYEKTYPQIVGKSELLAQYKQGLETQGKQFSPLTSDYGLAKYDAPLDNVNLFVPSHKFADKDSPKTFEFHSLQDFDEGAPKKFSKTTRKGTNVNDSFLAVYRGKNGFPPKKVFVVEGVSTAISTAALLGLDINEDEYKKIHDGQSFEQVHGVNKDDVWVLSSFDAGNINKVVNSIYENLGNYTEISVLGDNDFKVEHDNHGRPKRDANGDYIKDMLKNNAGREALVELWYKTIDINTAPVQKIVNSDGSLGFQITPKNISCALTPLELVDALEKESDVNDADVRWIKQGKSLPERIRGFYENYVIPLKDYKKTASESFARSIEKNPEFRQIAEQRIGLAKEQYQAVIAQAQQRKAQDEQVQAHVEQNKQPPVSAVESRQQEMIQQAQRQTEQQAAKTQSNNIESAQQQGVAVSQSSINRQRPSM